MKNFFLFILLLAFPLFSHALGLMKTDACGYADGIHREELYIYWPDEHPQVDEFLKYKGKLYYFIHNFPSSEALARYRKAGNSPYSEYGFIRNKWAFFVTFDCARSKVEFSPTIRSTSGDMYGKFYWLDRTYLSYTFTHMLRRNTCTEWPDTLVSLPDFSPLLLEKERWYPKSTKDMCYARGPYKSLGDGRVQFDVERHDPSTGESWFSRYQYQIDTRKLKKIR